MTDAYKAAIGTPVELVTVPDAGHGLMLLPRRWLVERSFAGHPLDGGAVPPLGLAMDRLYMTAKEFQTVVLAVLGM
jgi:hypothetical protein